MCHPVLVPSFLQEFDVANARVGTERNPQKTEVTYYVNDLEAAPPEWRIRDVQNMAKVTTVTEGCITLGVAVGRDSKSRVGSWARQTSHERVQFCQDLQKEFALLRESLGASRINHILRPHDSALKSSQHSALASPESVTKERETSRLEHTWARIQAMIQDAVLAGLLPKQPLETRVAAVIETATSTYLSALDKDE